MEWPSASSPIAFINALRAFLESQAQPTDTKPLEELLPRLGEIQQDDQDLWDKTLELLANASRDYKWREPIEQSGLLKYYLEGLDPGALPTTSSTQLLRAIGNAVADRDESRAVVLPCLEKIMNCLQNPALMPVAISVLYNVCLGYEPAQKEAAGLRLDRQLCRLLSHDNPVISQAIELLSWVSDKLPETVLVDSEDCLSLIIQFIGSCDEWEDFKCLIAASSVYLQDETIQSKILHSDGLRQITHILKKKTDQLVLMQPLMDEERKEFEEDLRITTGLVMNQLASITASDDFMYEYTLDSPLIQEQGEWLRASSPILQTCACIMLGNLAVTDQICTDMVHQRQYHIPTVDILKGSEDRSLLYLTAGFMRHLAQPKENAEIVSAAGAISASTALLSRKEPELDFEIAAILRRLTNNSYNNAAMLIRDEAADPPDSLEKLIEATKATKTGFEVGRLIVTLCRKLREAESVGEDTKDLWSRLLSHEALTKPLVIMIQQDQVPALASEAWFGFGLMAGSKEGAQRVAEAFAEETVFKVVRDAVLSGDVDSANRKNAMTVVHLLAQKLDDEESKTKFEGLARDGREGAARAE